MARKKTHAPLDVLINGRQVGRLEKAASGAISFRYSEEWLAWEHRFAASLSLPLTPAAYRGAPVIAVFDNLLPDRDAVRRRVAERMGAQGTDFYSLLEAIGRDCVGAMQFLPEGESPGEGRALTGTPLAEEQIAAGDMPLLFGQCGFAEFFHRVLQRVVDEEIGISLITPVAFG